MKTIIENQKGLALISVLLILLSLTVIGIVAVNSANIETLITTNNKVSKQAFFLAEAGGQEAKETLRQRIIDLASTLDAQINLVKGPDGILETADDLPFISKTLGAGSYTVKLTERSGPNVTLTSTGSGPLNSRAVVKLMVRVDTTPRHVSPNNNHHRTRSRFWNRYPYQWGPEDQWVFQYQRGHPFQRKYRLNGTGTVTGTVSAHGRSPPMAPGILHETPNAPTVVVPYGYGFLVGSIKGTAVAAGKATLRQWRCTTAPATWGVRSFSRRGI